VSARGEDLPGAADVGRIQAVKVPSGNNADDDREPQRDDRIPDVRDGLTRKERVVLYVLHEIQKERPDRTVPTAMLWGRVCEHFYISPEELSAMLARLGARR
jgi:hypothetical protein